MTIANELIDGDMNMSNVAGVETSHTVRPSAATPAGTSFLAVCANKWTPAAPTSAPRQIEIQRYRSMLSITVAKNPGSADAVGYPLSASASQLMK